MTTNKNNLKKTVVDHQAVATKATTQLRNLEAELVYQPPITNREKRSLSALLRIPTAAMNVAIDLAQRNPDRFGDFDVSQVQDAAAYETAMAPLSQQLKDVASRIDDSIVAAKAPAIEQTLALYGAAKSLARFKKGQSMRPQINDLKLLVRTTVKHRDPTAPTATATSTSPQGETAEARTAPPATQAETPATPAKATAPASS